MWLCCPSQPNLDIQTQPGFEPANLCSDRRSSSKKATITYPKDHVITAETCRGTTSSPSEQDIVGEGRTRF